MKYFGYILVFCFVMVHTHSDAQIIISATDTVGCDSLTTTFSQSNPTYSSILWRFGNGQTSNLPTPTITYKKPGRYSVRVILNGNDSTTKMDYIEVVPSPVAGIEFRDTVTGSPLVVALQAMVYNQNANLKAPYTYEWDIDGDKTATNQIAVHTFDSLGIYQAMVIITDSEGCFDTARMVVRTFEKLHIPNVFTPNNDNINDFFRISSNDKYYLNFQLFTRNGLLVYKTTAKTIIWDGKMSSGEDVPEGIYFYIIEAEGSSPNIKQKGFLYIYR